MEIVDAADRPGSSVHIVSSLAIDLFWALRGATSSALRDLHANLGALYATDPALRARVEGFWEDGSAGFGELVVLAQRGGVLTSTDPAQVLEGLAAASARPPGAINLFSEQKDDQERLKSRLGQLASSPTRRREYLSLIGEVMERAITAHLAQVIERSHRATEILRGEKSELEAWNTFVEEDFVQAARELQSRVEASGSQPELLVIPSAYSGRVLLFEVDDVVLCGIPTKESGLVHRQQIEEVAHRLKAVSDGTRLSVLGLCAKRPSTIGEIAGHLDVAQPTVSNHVKVLRDAGLLKGQRNGARRELVVDRAGVTQLVADLEQLVDQQITDDAR